MLVLTRKLNERIIIADDIVVELIEVHRDRARIGITAPENIDIHRSEVYEEIKNAEVPRVYHSHERKGLIAERDELRQEIHSLRNRLQVAESKNLEAELDRQDRSA